MQSMPVLVAVKAGETYTHYKTHRVYVIVGTALHTESGDTLVLYKRYSKPAQLWARPLAVFKEWIIVEDRQVWRFTRSTDEELLKELLSEEEEVCDNFRSEHHVV